MLLNQGLSTDLVPNMGEKKNTTKDTNMFRFFRQDPRFGTTRNMLITASDMFAEIGQVGQDIHLDPPVSNLPRQS